VVRDNESKKLVGSHLNRAPIGVEDGDAVSEVASAPSQATDTWWQKIWIKLWRSTVLTDRVSILERRGLFSFKIVDIDTCMMHAEEIIFENFEDSFLSLYLKHTILI
jgi:hypothetical protein